MIAVDRKIDEVNQSIDDVLAGTVPARVVFQFLIRPSSAARNCLFHAACPAEVSFSGQLADTMGGRRHYAGYEPMQELVT